MNARLLQTVVDVVPVAVTNPAPWPQIEFGAAFLLFVVLDAPESIKKAKLFHLKIILHVKYKVTY